MLFTFVPVCCIVRHYLVMSLADMCALLVCVMYLLRSLWRVKAPLWATLPLHTAELSAVLIPVPVRLRGVVP